MGMLLAQQLDQVVRREVDHQHGAARAQHACRLGERRGRIVGETQDVMEGRRRRSCRPRQGRWYMSPWRTSALSRLARSRLARATPASRATGRRRRRSDLGRQHLQQTAGAGADVEQALRRPVTEHAEQCALDHGLVEVQRADLIPAGGLSGKILRRLILARAADRRQTLTVEGQLGVLGRQHAAEVAREPGTRTRWARR